MTTILIVLMMGATSQSGRSAHSRSFATAPACELAAEEVRRRARSENDADRERVVVFCTPYNR